MDIRSDCWVAFENVSASTVDEAIERVESQMVPRLVGALSHRNLGAPYRIHIVGASDGKESFGDSRIVMTVSYEKTPLPDDWAAYANFRASCIDSNRHLTLAAELFHRGIRYQDLVSGRLTLAASVLAFYQTLEACARIPEWSPPTTYETERTRILSTAKTELDRKSTPKKQAQAIQKAATDLNRLENKYGDQRIFQAAESFGLDADWRRQARDLASFATSRLDTPAVCPDGTISRAGRVRASRLRNPQPLWLRGCSMPRSILSRARPLASTADVPVAPLKPPSSSRHQLVSRVVSS